MNRIRHQHQNTRKTTLQQCKLAHEYTRPNGIAMLRVYDECLLAKYIVIFYAVLMSIKHMSICSACVYKSSLCWTNVLDNVCDLEF